MKLRVSDHAVLRYLERHGGFEIEKLRQDIGRRLAPFAATGAHRIKIDGIVFAIREDAQGKTVTTVLEQSRSAPKQEREDGDG